MRASSCKKDTLLNTSPHCWLDGLEALCLMSARQRNPRLSYGGVPFGTAYGVRGHISSNARMDHFRTYIQHTIGQFFRTYKTHIPRLAVLPLEILCFVLCFRIVSINDLPPLARRGGARENPGADLQTAPFQHPYTRKSATTPPGVKLHIRRPPTHDGS